MSLRSALLSASIPVQKLMQKLHPPEPGVRYVDARALYRELKDGDILVSREAWHFTNLFIPGFWSHAAIFLDTVEGGKVVEAVAPRVQIVDFYEWILRKHNYAVMRPYLDDPMDGTYAARHAAKQKDAPYDYLFDHTNKAFYCSELVYSAYQDTNSPWAEEFVRRKTFGEVTVVPDDFYNAVKSGKLSLVKEFRA